VGELRKVGRHTLVYGVGVVITKLASFLMLPVYTRHLSPAEYGTLELLGTTIDVIGMVAGIGLAAGVFKHYAEARTAGERNRLMSTVALGAGGLALATALLGMLAAPLITRTILGGTGTAQYLRMFFAIYFLQSVGGVAFILIQAQERSRLFVTLSAAKLIATLSLTIWFVVKLRLGIFGVLSANLIATGVLTIGLAAYTFRTTGFHFSLPIFQTLSRFGAPVVAWSVGSFILTFSDRYFLNHYAGAGEVGVYSLAYKFSFLLSAFAVAPFSQVWEPRRFAIAQNPDAGEIYRRMFFYLNLALVGGAVGILLFVRDVLGMMVDPAYLPAARVVPLLLVTTIIQQWTGYCNLGLYLKNATHLYGWSAVIGVVAALGLNALLIPRYGVLGAAWATVIAYAIRFVPVYLFSQARYHIPYDWAKVAELCAILGAAWGARGLADAAHLPVAGSLAVSAAILAAATTVVYLRLLSGAERAMVRGFLLSPFPMRRAAAVA
jgi:O-antigen/teichoic acid export membrane protein